MLYRTSTSSSDPDDRPVDSPHVEDHLRPALDTALGLRRLVSIALTLGLISAITYLVPSFERVRPWVQGEGVPVVRLFLADHQPAALPDFQGSTAAAVANPSPPEAAVPGIDVEFDLEDTAPPEPSGKGSQPSAVIAPKSQGSRIASKEYSGASVPIENAAAIGSFFEALGRSARGEPGAITRVAHYGDSSVAADQPAPWAS